jgi:hypothetical protein
VSFTRQFVPHRYSAIDIGVNIGITYLVMSDHHRSNCAFRKQAPLKLQPFIRTSETGPMQKVMDQGVDGDHAFAGLEPMQAVKRLQHAKRVKAA